MIGLLGLGLMYCAAAIEQKLLDVPLWITPLNNRALRLDLQGRTVALTRDDKAVARIKHKSQDKYKLTLRGTSVCHKKRPKSTMGACNYGKNKANTWIIESKHGGYTIKSTKKGFLQKIGLGRIGKRFRKRCLAYDGSGNLKIRKCAKKKANQLFDIRCADPSVCGSEKDVAKTPESAEEKDARKKPDTGDEDCVDSEDEAFQSSSFSSDSGLFGMDPQVPKITSRLPSVPSQCYGAGAAQYPAGHAPQCVCTPLVQGTYAYPPTYAVAQ